MEMWRSMSMSDVYDPLLSVWSLSHNVITAFTQAVGIRAASRPPGLLRPGKLGQTLPRLIGFRRIQTNVRNGTVAALGVIALSIARGRSVVFAQGGGRQPSDYEHAIDYVQARISAAHVMASLSLPAAYPAIRIQTPAAAAGWYTNGGVQLTAPIKPVLALGADRVVAVATEPLLGRPSEPEATQRRKKPDVEDMLSVILGDVMADRLAQDVYEMAQRNVLINSALGGSESEPIGRPVPFLLVAPRDRGTIGLATSRILRTRFGGLSSLIREPDSALLFRVFPADGPRGGQLMSNLFFDPDLIAELIGLGHQDALRAMSTRGVEPWKLDPDLRGGPGR
jgi:NTE family protein